MEFNPEQRLDITNSIIELNDPSESCEMVERRSRRNHRFNEDAIVFYDNDRLDLLSSHNWPLYVIASVDGVELKRANSTLGLLSTLYPFEC